MTSEKKWIGFDYKLSSYLSFWDNDWADKILGLTDSTRLDSAAFSLVAGWRSLSEMFRLPDLMMESLSTFYQSISSKRPVVHHWIEQLNNDLVNEMNTTSNGLNRKQKRRLQHLLKEKFKKANQIRTDEYEVLTKEDFWQGLTTASLHLPLAISGSQRMTYAGLYFYYEDFLKQSHAALNGLDKYEPMTNQLINDFERDYSTVASRLLTVDEIRIAREARNSIAHCGCKETKKLERLPHAFEVKSGEILILPDHARNLFQLLKENVTCFIESQEGFSS